MRDYDPEGGNTKWSKCKESTQRLFICELLTSIGSYAFNSFPNLTSIVFPEGIVSIGECAFCHCTSDLINLSEFIAWDWRICIRRLFWFEVSYFQSYLYFIREYAFYGCSKLSSINFELALLIDGSAFGETSISIPLLSPVDEEFLIEIGEKYLKGNGLPQNISRAIEIFYAAQRVGETDSNFDVLSS